MRNLASGMQLVKFDLHSLFKQSPFQPRNITTRHSRLVETVENTRDGWKESGSE